MTTIQENGWAQTIQNLPSTENSRVLISEVKTIMIPWLIDIHRGTNVFPSWSVSPLDNSVLTKPKSLLRGCEKKKTVSGLIISRYESETL